MEHFHHQEEPDPLDAELKLNIAARGLRRGAYLGRDGLLGVSTDAQWLLDKRLAEQRAASTDEQETIEEGE